MGKTTKKKRSKITAYNNWGYLFVAPFVIVFLIFSVYPVLRTLYLSFTDLKILGDANWIWFDNYKRVLGDKFFWKALGNTVRIWVVNIVLQLGLAFLLMMVLTEFQHLGKLSLLMEVIYIYMILVMGLIPIVHLVMMAS